MNINHPEYYQYSFWDELKEIGYSGKELLEQLRQVFEVDFMTGFPCGELREFIQASASRQDLQHSPATNEREAVGIAAGAWLAGKTPALYMQNSGLFEASNDVGSLLVACKIPAVFVVSWRGAPGETATQHKATGEATASLLSSFRIEYTDSPNGRQLCRLRQMQEQAQLPVCVLQKREGFNNPQQSWVYDSHFRNQAEVWIEPQSNLFSREEVLDLVARRIPPSSAIISSTGLISRSLYHHHDSPNQFYNAGAFGLTSSIGLGVCLARPEGQVIVMEGDGSVLTDLGNLNLIGHYKPNRFIHIVLNNKSYVSCSGEPTIGSDRIVQLAATLGYKRVFSTTSLQSTEEILSFVLHQDDGPQMLHIDINNQGERNFKRPLDMAVSARRFRSNFL